MRLLWYNKLQDAVITVSSESTDISANFPKENLLVYALSIPFKSIQPSVQMTVTFNAVETINCLAFAGHNMNTFRYRTYDESDVLIVDVLINELLATEMLYVGSASIKKIVINMTADDYIQIGYLSIGEYYQMPNPLAYYEEAIIITNRVDTNLFGQVYGSDGVFLQTYSPDFVRVSNDRFKEIRAIVDEVRNYKSIFVDMTEDNHDYKKPLYATLDFERFDTSRYKAGVMEKTFQLAIREVK